MPHKDPQNYNFITYVWVLILSFWGGTAHTIRKIKSGEIKRFTFSEWVGDIVISGFLGVITFYLCDYAGIEAPLNAALVGISAHQGTRGIVILEKIIAKRIGIKEQDG